MAEPNSTAAGIAIATGTVTLGGTVLGMQADVLLLGLFGGLLYVMQQPAGSVTKGRLAGALATSSLLAGVGAPIAAAAMMEHFAFLARVPEKVLMGACAVGVGLVAQRIVAGVLARSARLAGGEAGAPGQPGTTGTGGAA